jgi:hypothetical protein
MNPVEALGTEVIDATRSVHVGVIYISLTNLLIIIAMLIVFVLALVLPFPHRRPIESVPSPDPGDDPDGTIR